MNPRKLAGIGSRAIVALVLALALAPPARASEPVSVADPVGDGTAGGPDIEQIVLTPTDTVIGVQIVFTAEWQPGWSLGIVLSRVTHVCSGYGAPYAIGLPSATVGGTDPGPGLVAGRRSGYSDATPLDHVIDGPSVTISIPRELIGDPHALNFAVFAAGDGSGEWDRSPDEENACHSVGVARQQGPDTAMHRPTSNWMAIVLGLLAVLTAVALRRRPGNREGRHAGGSPDP